jgi:hypothetical protein
MRSLVCVHERTGRATSHQAQSTGREGLCIGQPCGHDSNLGQQRPGEACQEDQPSPVDTPTSQARGALQQTFCLSAQSVRWT